MEDAINFLTDAIEYLRGRDGKPANPEAALDAIEEAKEAIDRLNYEAAR